MIIVFFLILTVIINWIALRQGFYALPIVSSQRQSVSLKSLLAVFAIYLGAIFFFAPLLVRLIHTIYSVKGVPIPVFVQGSVQILVFSVILLLFYLFCRTQDPLLVKKIWKDYSKQHVQTVSRDFLYGVLAWLVSFPLVTLVGGCLDTLLLYFFGLEPYEQVAVRYLRMALSSKELLISALISILIAAPIVEEFLFRGFLQTYLKKYVSVKMAIMLASLCFALFHFSPSQGLGNISLVGALFIFSLFLGFVYERQASLFASIGLHMTFNTLSAVRILFLSNEFNGL